jgi:2-iminobutanoate/2-iminopropanoate deaminase
VQREVISTDKAPGAIGPYSQAIKASGSFLFCSGQIALTPGGELVHGDIRTQTHQCMTNIAGLLGAAGIGFENIVKTTIFLSSMDHFGAVNEVYGSYFHSAPPARSTVAAAGLPKGVDVEIEVIAAL